MIFHINTTDSRNLRSNDSVTKISIITTFKGPSAKKVIVFIVVLSFLQWIGSSISDSTYKWSRVDGANRVAEK